MFVFFLEALVVFNGIFGLMNKQMDKNKSFLIGLHTQHQGLPRCVLAQV
jgi:hypothetical protein